jgi:hypothetical protein
MGSENAQNTKNASGFDFLEQYQQEGDEFLNLII